MNKLAADSPVDHQTLSVVLPNYNHAQFLPRALAALLAQDVAANEIIVVDDASTDDSRDVVASFQADHANLVLVENSANQGALRALQLGLQRARGRYVYFAAADDEVLPGFFARALALLEAHPESGLFCAETVLLDGATGASMGMRPVVRPLRRSGYLEPAGVERLLRHADNFIHTGSSIFRRAAVLEKGGFDAALGSFADGILARKIALSHGLCFDPHPVAAWIIHEGGLSRGTALSRGSAREALTTIPAMLARDADLPSWYAEAFDRRWRFGAARLALEARPVDQGLLADMAATTPLDASIVSAFSPLLGSRPGRFAMLAWLTLRLKPFRLRDLIATALARRFQRAIR